MRIIGEDNIGVVMKNYLTVILNAALILCGAVTILCQEGTAVATGKPIMWEPANISQRNLYLGPGGAEMQPDFSRAKFLGEQAGGNNLKYRIADTSGHVWVVKMADESQPEVAAVRLLWAIGYPTEINYIVPKMNMGSKGNFKNVRAEARPEGVNRLDRWSWENNPFKGSREFDGLKMMMAMFNNWDLKDENNVILQKDGKDFYAIADLGSSFGRGATTVGGRGGRSVNNPVDYANSKFITTVRNGFVELDFKTYNDRFIQGISVENARWLAGLLRQLSDAQIQDAFRAANYNAEEVIILSKAFQTRIKQLDDVTRLPKPPTRSGRSTN